MNHLLYRADESHGLRASVPALILAVAALTLTACSSTGVVAASSATGATSTTAPAASASPSAAEVPGTPSAATTTPRSAAVTAVTAAAGPEVRTMVVHSIDVAGRIAVVQPVRMVDGPEYCRVMHLPAGRSECKQEWALVVEGPRRSVRVSPHATFASVLTPDQSSLCTDAAGVGRCSVSERVFAGTLVSPNRPVQVRIVGGELTRAAQIYTP